MIDVQETNKKIDILQAKADEIRKKKNRLEGETEANEKRIKELEERSVQEVGVPTDKLPSVLQEYSDKIAKAIEESEAILNDVK